jgi:nicotinamide mononucleotide transporter
MNWLASLDWWQIGANGASTVSIVLAARNSVHLWWTGIVGSALFIVVFSNSQLYADASLQVFFIATSVIGWKSWMRSAGQPQRPVSSTRPVVMASMIAAAVPAVAVYALILHRYTDAYAPFVDAFVVGASVVSTYLLMYRRIETWPGWLIVNTVSVPLFASRGLTLTAWLYAAYWFNAWLGWRHWRNERVAPTTVVPA